MTDQQANTPEFYDGVTAGYDDVMSDAESGVLKHPDTYKKFYRDRLIQGLMSEEYYRGLIAGINKAWDEI